MSAKTNKWLHWLDDNILLILSGFLIAFIPLYPKIPLLEAIPGYIVRVRLEDMFVLLAAGIWLVQVIRKKVEWKNIIFWMILVYAVVGLLSVLSAVFITQTVPLEPIHLGKTALHYFRYLEYFVLFLITFSAVKSKKDVKILLTVFTMTFLAVTVYGYGQKYFYWPVYSTMNREFSKGKRLYLTEHARVQSTFGGHYDLAGFVMMACCLFLALAYKQKNKWKKIGYHAIHIISLWLLIMSASRVSLAAYFLGAAVVVILVAKEQEKLLEKIKWGTGRFLGLFLITSIMMFSFGHDVTERFLHILKDYPQVNNTYQAIKDFQDDASEGVLIAVGVRDPDTGESKYQPPEDGLSIDEVMSKTDERPVDEKPSERPDDVYVDVPVTETVATTSAEGITTYKTVQKDRTWSENAMKYGLSVAIRLDELWPNAINGFLRNPLLGSGYGTLNKEAPHHFTEAESTDNNFLRTLGETGLLGFVSFYGIIAVSIYFAYKFHQIDRTYTSAISVGFIGASIGLLLNATYIDVYAASKIAFTYWALTGIVLALYYQGKNEKKLKNTKLMNWFVQLKQRLGNHKLNSA